VRLLFVCTGNLCRSPVAERLTAARAHRSGLGDDVVVESAGVAAASGQPMHPHSAAALVRLGGDPTGFRSRPFSAELATDAELVLTMTRRQRRAVLEQTPRGLRRTFTLREAADLLPRADLTGVAGLPPAARARELGLRLDAARAGRRSSAADDIDDPIGGKAAAHLAVAEAVAAALAPLADVLFGPPSADRTGAVPHQVADAR
jgi:protein-tyrosine phosphatase